MKLSSILLAATLAIAAFAAPATASAGSNVSWNVTFTNGGYYQPYYWHQPNVVFTFGNYRPHHRPHRPHYIQPRKARRVNRRIHRNRIHRGHRGHRGHHRGHHGHRGRRH